MKLILGSMKSGKSALLLEVANDLAKTKGQNEKLIFIRPSCDNREFISRSREPVVHLKFGDERVDLRDYDYIFIDEIQFFEKEYIDKLISLRNKKVLMVAGLNADINNKIWSNITKLIPYASSIKFLKANCDICGAKESAIHHIGDGKVGDDYFVVCPKCYKSKNYFYKTYFSRISEKDTGNVYCYVSFNNHEEEMAYCFLYKNDELIRSDVDDFLFNPNKKINSFLDNL